MTACIICGAECPPRKPGHNGGGRPRKLCGALDCRRLRNRERQGLSRELRRHTTGRYREHEKALKTLRQACARRKLRLRARTTRDGYDVRIYEWRRRLRAEQGTPLEAIAAARAWLNEARPGKVQRRRAAQQVRERTRETRMTTADYAWGAA